MSTQEGLKAIYEARWSRYEKHLHAGMDTTSIILKGHLFVEESLFDILKLHCRDSGPIENIKLGFSHKLNHRTANWLAKRCRLASLMKFRG